MGGLKSKKMDNDTPIPPFKKRKLEQRVNDLETSYGKMMGEIGRMWDAIGERISEATFSISPTKARGTFKNLNAWVWVIALVVIAVIAWIIKR